MENQTVSSATPRPIRPLVRDVIASQLEELVSLGREIRRNALEAIQLMGEERFQEACDTVSLTHYPVVQTLAAWRGSMDTFRLHGYQPGEAQEQSAADRAATQATLDASAGRGVRG